MRGPPACSANPLHRWREHSSTAAPTTRPTGRTSGLPCCSGHRRCDTCVDALQAAQTASDQTEDTVFVTVLTFDDPQAGRDAVAFIGTTLPVLDDPEGVIFDQGQAFGWPWLILIDSTGTVVEVRGGGFNGYIATNLDEILNEAPW